MNYSKVDIYPNAEQKLLISACLEANHLALDSYARWKEQIDITCLDSDTSRLLPLLYKNISSYTDSDTLLPTLKDYYRLSWCRNQVLFNNLKKIISLFSQKGIDTLLLKGAALSHLCYRDVGTRMMEDVDILIPYTKIEDAITILDEQGYRFVPSYEIDRQFDVRNLPLGFIEHNHAMNFFHSLNNSIDLHWYAVPDCVSPEIDKGFWSRAIVKSFNGVDTRFLNHEDMLLQICVHGYSSGINDAPSIRWLLDAIMILRSKEGAFDWDQFYEEAKKRDRYVPVFEMLDYIKNEYGAFLPQFNFGSSPRNKIDDVFNENSESKAQMRNTLMFQLKKNLEQYRRYQMLNGQGFFTIINPINLLEYVKSKFGFYSRSHVFSWVARRVSRKFFNK